MVGKSNLNAVVGQRFLLGKLFKPVSFHPGIQAATINLRVFLAKEALETLDKTG